MIQDSTRNALLLGPINAAVLMGLGALWQHFSSLGPESEQPPLMLAEFDTSTGRQIMPPMSALHLKPENIYDNMEMLYGYPMVCAIMILVWFFVCYGQLRRKHLTVSAAHNDNVEQDEKTTVVPIEQTSQQDESNEAYAPRTIRQTNSYYTTASEEGVLESCFDDTNHVFYEMTVDQMVEDRNPANSPQRAQEILVAPQAPSAMTKHTCLSCSGTVKVHWRFCCNCGAAVSINTNHEGVSGRDLILEEPRTPAIIYVETHPPKEPSRTTSRQAVDVPLTIQRSRSEERNAAPERTPKRTNSAGSIKSYKTAKSMQSQQQNQKQEDQEERTPPPRQMVQNRFYYYARPKSLDRLLAGSEELIVKDDFMSKQKRGYANIVSEAERVLMETTENCCLGPQSGAHAIKFRRTDSVCIGSRLWSLSHLASRYPPNWGHPHKKIIADISSTQPQAGPDDWVRASRWSRPSALPKRVKRAKVYVESGQLSHDTMLSSKRDHQTIHWHVNFSGHCLFTVGEGATFDENELQVLEHPCLASLALAIQDSKTHGVKGLSTQTHEPQVGPTPVLIKGAHRKCQINSSMLDPAFFASASKEEVREATTPCETPMITNFVAVPMVATGTGKYTVKQIRRLYIYAYTAFKAVVLDSGGRKPVLHTGFWGCGADEGGNKGLTAAIQILAAGTAGIKNVHFKPGDDSAFDRSAMWHGINVANALHGKGFETFVETLVTAGYKWGDHGPSHLPEQPPK